MCYLSFSIMVVIDPISVENRIWGDRIETYLVCCRWFKVIVRCDIGSLWLVIISKSKDRFMEQATMKTVQP
jgi:hypothetical protein